MKKLKKGSLVHEAPACAGSGASMKKPKTKEFNIMKKK
jgi:hypothetical protein